MQYKWWKGVWIINYNYLDSFFVPVSVHYDEILHSIVKSNYIPLLCSVQGCTTPPIHNSSILNCPSTPSQPFCVLTLIIYTCTTTHLTFTPHHMHISLNKINYLNFKYISFDLCIVLSSRVASSILTAACCCPSSPYTIGELVQSYVRRDSWLEDIFCSYAPRRRKSAQSLMINSSINTSNYCLRFYETIDNNTMHGFVKP